MGKNKAEQEELKKLEDEAYFELCQIIAEAMQFQDINLLDQRIDYWKKKYKKLLDSSNGSASANFKKRIEFLLNEYYSEITQYILKQIRLKEEKKIENQSKALRKLYRIIKDTDDLTLLKKKVKEWEEKYPVSSFLKMYQRKIKLYTSDKNLESNAFDQDKAFHDLYYITKLNRTFDEFQKELSDWEDKYSIHDKFELDDFIKHQTEVNRYASDEYLKSIARVEENTEDVQDNKEIIIIPVKETKSNTYKKDTSSSLSNQAAAYATLVSIAKKSDNTDEMFKWVYKNSSIRFDDKYKELILNAIHLDYSPSYLSFISAPKIKFSGSMSLEEYQNIDEIKKYTIISYFNLLLPPEESISNNFFNQYIETIYQKSKSNHEDLNNNHINDILQSGVEISLSPKPENDLTKKDTTHLDTVIELKDNYIKAEESDDISSIIQEQNITNHSSVNDELESIPDMGEEEIIPPEVTHEQITLVDNSLPTNLPNVKEVEITIQEKPDDKEILSPEIMATTLEPKSDEIILTEPLSEKNSDTISEPTYDTVIALSPQFFKMMDYYNTQAILIEKIDNDVNRQIDIEDMQLSPISKNRDTNIN